MARLLFVTGTSPDVRAGSGTFVGITVLRAALEARGHRIDLLAPPPGRGPLSLPGRLSFNLRARHAALRIPSDTDAMVGFDLDGVFIPRGKPLRVAALKGVVAEEARFERRLTRLRLTAEAALERRHVRGADRVIATSEHSASRIEEDYGISRDRIRIVPEPIDLSRWSQALETAPRLLRGRPSILCVAHLYPRKDVRTLLDAVARLAPDVVLRVVGTGPEEESLARRANRRDLQGRVELLGHVSFERLAAEYRRADVFCLPSRQEGFGIVFLEAMAAGLPIVAARCAAVPEIVRQGEGGLLVPPRDPEALAGALSGLLSDRRERRRLSEGGLRRVRDYDAPLVAERFMAALDLG